MTTSIIDSFPKQSNFYQNDQHERALYCQLLWRRNQLLIKPVNYRQKKYIYVLSEEKTLIDCLCNSPVSLIRIDPQVGIEQLIFWINACEAANKPIYFYIPKGDNSNLFFNAIQQLINSFLACVLLVLLMPLILTLILWIKFYSHQLAINYEWCVGRRGKLFKRIRFNFKNISFIDDNSDINMSAREIIQKYAFDRIPELLNVIRGEMLLFGYNSLTIKDAAKLTFKQQKQLNKMPALISIYSHWNN
ncbi:hypothetical protein RintRC_1170 [Richelia intracellularis]|nr:hypothetical protein RintRC_1170 [Richelia intracellularis]